MIIRQSRPEAVPRNILLLSIACSCIVCASTAHADAGTPLMWVGFLHLTLGNLVIGIVEGILVWRLLHSRLARAIPWMICANYMSMMCGFLLAAGLAGWIARVRNTPPLYLVAWGLVACTAVSYLASVMLEWPFVWLSGVKGSRSWSRAGRVSLIINAASYAVLIPIYLMSSHNTAITQTHFKNPAEFVRSPIAWVYYIGLDDGAVWRVRTDGTNRERVLDARLSGQNSMLYAQRNADGTGFDLIGVRAGEARNSETSETLIRGFAAQAGEWPYVNEEHTHGSPSGRPVGLWLAWGAAVDLRPADKRTWTARTGFHVVDGLMIQNMDKEYRLVSVETPFLWWDARCATVVPSGQIVWQLGPQILIYDPESRNLGVLALGQGPVVGLDAG